MSKVAILLPRTAAGFIQQEECCWAKASTWTPSLPFHIASLIRLSSKLWDPVLVPIDVAATSGTSPGCELETMMFTWPFGDVLEPLLGRENMFDIIANPDCTQAPFELKHPMLTFHASEFFTRAIPLPFDALADEHWGGFDRVLYQLTSGCPHGCRFCVWGKPYVVREPGLAAREIAELLERVPGGRTAGGNHRQDACATNDIRLSLLCNEITGKSKWLRELCDGIGPLGVEWRSDANCRNATEDDLQMAAAAGCRQLVLGIEFLEDEMLERLGKGHTVARALYTMLACQYSEIRYHFSLRQGVGETVAHVERMMVNIKRMAALLCTPEWIRIGPMLEHPGGEWLPEGERVNAGTAAYPIWRLKLAPDLVKAWGDVRELCKSLGFTVKG